MYMHLILDMGINGHLIWELGQRRAMELSDEQRRRMEMNRAAALARRATKPVQSNQQAEISHSDSHKQEQEVRLELCSPGEFYVFYQKPGNSHENHLVKRWLESVPSADWKLVNDARWPVYKLKNYEKVIDGLRRIPGVKLEQVPQSTQNALKRYVEAKASGEWVPFHKRHVAESVVDGILSSIPRKLRRCLLPFQWQGVRYGLRRGGRVLIADEMGVGKTIQAIAIAACYLKNGPVLVVCPASLRFVWAEEIERWMPSLSPSDIHLVLGSKDDVRDRETIPKVVVISFNMLRRLRDSMLQHKWEVVIIDESHNMRCSRRPQETEETSALIRVAREAPRAILLSGTPSLSRPFDIYNQVDCLWPGILGRSKYEFRSNYCSVDDDDLSQRFYKDYTKGRRLEELNILLKDTVMIRRLKSEILKQLPPKRRLVIRVKLSSTDITEAKASCEQRECELRLSDDENKCDEEEGTSLSDQELGVAKLRAVIDWLSSFPFLESEEERQKLILFAHHHKVLNALQVHIVSRNIEFVRIDGLTDAKDRQKAVQMFRQSNEVRVALVGVTAGGVGLDLSTAQNLVFVELPKTASELVQAEDRAHRRGQKSAVNIYIFCAKDTTDESHWQSISRSLERVSTMTNGSDHAIPGLEVETVIDRTISESGCAKIQCPSSEPPPLLSDNTVSEKDKPNEEAELLRPDDGMVSELNDDNVDASSLMFEVSLNTGRLHLYKKTAGQSSVTSLEENFRPEDLELDDADEIFLPKCIRENASHKAEAKRFLREWKELRPVFQKKLYGRPLQVPLRCELSRLTDLGSSHADGGLLRGGSRKRTLSREELKLPLPDGATWRDVLLYRTSSCDYFTVAQPWTADGNPLCRLCQRPCKKPAAKNPKLMEDLFCKEICYEEYRLRTSQQYLRRELFGLERGVCVRCDLDCHALAECIRNLEKSERSAYILRKAPSFGDHKVLLQKLVEDPSEGNAWHADHIVPVYAGGGECNLENMRTLCVVCHVAVTSKQCSERHVAAVKARRALNYRVEKLSKRLKTVEEYEDISDSSEDEEMLKVEVAGSSYFSNQVLVNVTIL